jgi:hypothetical protein
LVVGDKDKLVTANNAAAITVTVPPSVFSATDIVNVSQYGAGQVTIAATGGVTLNSTPGSKLRAQWSAATLIKRATDTWVLSGDLSA